ncbi:protein TolR [Yersinia pestis]|nr:protein TolR [Yersinia pestis]
MAMRMNDSLDESGELHEINVTPFIDVMLVLLIIFMVAAPLATVDIKVDLPASSAVPQPRPEKPVFLTVKADNQLYVGDQPVDRETLATALDKVTQSNKETTIFFQADKVVDYETLMSVMDALRKSGYLKVGLVGMEAGSSGAKYFCKRGYCYRACINFGF